MATTILPRKSFAENPLATDDEAHALLVADPTVPQFQASGTYAVTQPVPPQPVLTNAAPTNAASDADVLVENTNQHWVNTKWRPAMGWMYMIVCITDFVIFPVLWSILQAVFKGNVTAQWQPLTLQGAGLFHLAMGAVLGIAAYGRTREKIETGKV